MQDYETNTNSNTLFLKTDEEICGCRISHLYKKKSSSKIFACALHPKNALIICTLCTGSHPVNDSRDARNIPEQMILKKKKKKRSPTKAKKTSSKIQSVHKSSTSSTNEDEAGVDPGQTFSDLFTDPMMGIPYHLFWTSIVAVGQAPS